MRNFLISFKKVGQTFKSLYFKTMSSQVNLEVNTNELEKPMKVFDGKIRDKPFIVICGCTGTGKTKLSIQLAKWLIKNNKKCEIINADAMQLYKNLDIITNKATKEEMEGIKHNLIGYIDYSCKTYTVGDYVKKAVQLIDNLLEEDKIPILVGGTNYYIHSVLYDALIDEPVGEPIDQNIIPKDETDSEIVSMIMESIKDDEKRTGKKENEKNAVETDMKDLNVKFHDSAISTSALYEHLKKVDLESALKIHPNDRRKSIRSLQIYYTYGKTKTDLQNKKNSREGSGLFHGPIRYKNACVFAMNSEDKILNERLDQRVEQMIQNGLVDELKTFKLEFDAKHKNQSLKEFSRDYQFGIFQSIGFKEFDEYFKYFNENVSDSDLKLKDEIFKKCVDEMKMSTRRYARIQLRWIKNRFIKRACENSPQVTEIDTSDISNWDNEIFGKAQKEFQNYLDGTQIIKSSSETQKDSVFQYNKCESCDRVFVDKFQWECHIKSRKHKKVVEKLKRHDKQKRKAHIDLVDTLENVKKLKEAELEIEPALNETSLINPGH